jgi:mono/diheme cytochrome c family protein
VRPVSVTVFCVVVGATAALAAEQQFNLPQGPGRELVYGNCQTCHDLQSVVDSAGIRRGAWDALLDNMRDYGLRITADQRAKILDYLGTYLGPNPPAAPATATAAAGAADGAQVFADTCAACHQPNGEGKAGDFPPLAGNPDLFLATDFPAAVVLHGLQGPIDVAGASLDQSMPSFDFLSDDEIAAVIGYVRASWGNDKLRPASFADLTADEVKALRDKAMTPDDVHAYRASLEKK